MATDADADLVTGPAVSVPSIPDDEIVSICKSFGNDRHRMLDILREAQDRFRWISPRVMEIVARETGLSRIEVEGVASFYSFLSQTPKGPGHDPALRRHRRPILRAGGRCGGF
jgi:[NiFe] hydrogenase diaphorase moiety large subunit